VSEDCFARALSPTFVVGLASPRQGKGCLRGEKRGAEVEEANAFQAGGRSGKDSSSRRPPAMAFADGRRRLRGLDAKRGPLRAPERVGWGIFA